MGLTTRQWRAMLTILTGLILIGALRLVWIVSDGNASGKVEQVAEKWGFEISTTPSER